MTIAIIPEDKPWKFVANDDGDIIIPDNMADLQNFLDALWTKIFENNERDKIKLYNAAAEKYNKQAGFQAITTINNFLKQKKMATKKTAAKKAAAKKAQIVKKSKTIDETPVKKVSQKTQIVELAEKGKTINEIVEVTGIKKANVQWYFSKLKLGK